MLCITTGTTPVVNEAMPQPPLAGSDPWVERRTSLEKIDITLGGDDASDGEGEWDQMDVERDPSNLHHGTKESVPHDV